MAVKELTSRLFYVRGETTVDTILSKDGRAKPIADGRCTYLARVEIGDLEHPELKDSKVNIRNLSTHINIYGKGEGDRIPYERLWGQYAIMPEKANDASNSFLQEMVAEHFPGRSYNVNLIILSAFDGYYQGFNNRFDETKTFAPVVAQALDEVAAAME